MSQHEVADRIREVGRDKSVVIVAIDGRSGAGKSTLAAELAGTLSAAVIEGDDFYAGGSRERWLAMAPVDRAARCMSWKRQRPVLAALRASKAASFHAFDWETFDGRLSAVRTTIESAPVVLLEGAYSARPELADLVDLRILVNTPEARRREQLLEREGAEYRDDWESLWSSAEDHYFGIVMPEQSFDLVMTVPSFRD